MCLLVLNVAQELVSLFFIPPQLLVLIWLGRGLHRGLARQLGRGLQGCLRTGCPLVPLTSPEKQTPQEPHGHLPPERQANSLSNPNLEHQRPSGYTEGAVVLLESPTFRRKNLDSEQDVPKVKISIIKWKWLAGLPGLAGLSGADSCKSASFLCTWLAIAWGQAHPHSPCAAC